MVLDMLHNFGKYVALNPYFPLVEAFMREHLLEELAPGTYNIKGEDVVLKVEMATGKSQSEAILESHRQMTYRFTPKPLHKTISHALLEHL